MSDFKERTKCNDKEKNDEEQEKEENKKDLQHFKQLQISDNKQNIKRVSSVSIEIESEEVSTSSSKLKADFDKELLATCLNSDNENKVKPIKIFLTSLLILVTWHRHWHFGLYRMCAYGQGLV